MQLNGFSSSDFARASVGGFQIDLPAIAPHGCVSHIFTANDRHQSDRLIVNPTGNTPYGLVVQPTYDINSGPLEEFRACNVTDATIDPPAGHWGYVEIHL